MRSTFLRLALTYMLCVTLLLTLGMKFAIPKPAEADADAKSASMAHMLAAPAITSAVLPLHMPLPALEADVKQNVNTAKPSAAPKVVQQKATVYETTAYFLNVRANPYSTSKILKTVPKGTRLEVLAKTANGWLRLKGVGYVHGDYAPIVSSTQEPQPQTLPRSEAIPLTKKDVPKKSGQPAKPTSLVNSESGLTEEQIAAFFKGTALAGHGLEKAVLETEREYGINAYFTVAVMKLESGNGRSRLAKNKNNLFGLNAIDGDEYNRALSFKTKGDSVRKFGQLIAKSYVGKGYTTIEKVARKYCSANSKWPISVKNIMKRDYKKL